MIKRLISKSISLGTSATARALYWVFSGNAVAIILAFVTTIIIARFLTKEEFGIFLALYAFAALLSDIGDIGIGPSLSSFLPPLLMEERKADIDETLSAAFYLELITSAGIGGIVLILISPLAKSLFAGTSTYNLAISLGIMFAVMLFNFAILALSAQKKFRESAVVNVASSVFRLLLLAIVFLLSKVTLFSVLLVYLAGPLAGWIYSLIFLRLTFLRPRLNFGKAKTLFKFSGWIGLQKIFIAISSRLDLLMLVPLASAYEAGVYGAASRIAQIYPFFISSFSQVMAPKFAEYKSVKEGLGFLRKSGLVALLFLVSLGIFYIFADLIIGILFPKYSESIPVFRALLLSMVGFVAATPFVSLLIYTLKKPAIIAVSTLVQLFVIFLINLFVIPSQGRFGPAIGIGIGNIVVFLISAIATLYYLKIES